MASANAHQVPIILDPVAAGATDYRRQTLKTLLQNHAIAIIRGNAAEIAALSDQPHYARGVDSLMSSQKALGAGQYLAEKYHCIVVINGEIDYVISSQNHIAIHNGHSLMTKVTGMGCALASIIATFHAINIDGFRAAAHACLYWSIVGEIVALQPNIGPGTFRQHFLDKLDQITFEELNHYARFEND